MKKIILSLVPLALMAFGMGVPAHAQTAMMTGTTMNSMPMMTASTATNTMSSGMMANTSMSSGSMMMSTANLSEGDTGEGVSWLQNFLISKGYLTISNGVGMGDFGPRTVAALMQFQTAEGLSAHGFYGPLTRAKINAAMSMMPMTSTPATTSMPSITTSTGMSSGGTSMNMNSGTSMMSSGASAQSGVMVGGALMVPNLDIVQNAVNASNVTTLVAAVKAAGLVPTLEGAGPFTVFAPDNNAFAKLPAGTVATLLMPANLAQLKNLLTYHVVSGAYTSKNLYTGEVLKTVEGGTITIGRNASNQLTINGVATVETPDIISSNGVTFVIDTVLTPSVSNTY